MSQQALAAITLAVVGVFAGGCRHAPVAVPPPPKQDVLVLLPDPDTQAVGRAVVSSPSGPLVELATARAATHVSVGHAPTAPVTMSEAQVQTLFGEALAARPPAPRRFLLYFVLGSNQLTPESEPLLSAVLDFVKNRPAPDVTVIGHTDTTDTARANLELGLRRAAVVRQRLVETGVDPSLVSVASHGEADLLVRTPDNTLEPKNRRVEVSVR